MPNMKVRIGIADTGKVVEIEVEDVEAFQSEVERAVADGGLAWFIDTKARTVGVPAQSISFVEIEAVEGGPSVGFAPAV